MEALQTLAVHLGDLIKLPDPEAAVSLNSRLGAIDRVERRAFAERVIIVREFETRHLWKHLIDPDTGETFPNLTAWMSCSVYMGCRRTNFEAKKTAEMLSDVPSEKLIDIPKANLNTLAHLSTAVRNQPEVLEAARTMKPEHFEEQIAEKHPQQHIDPRKPVPLHFGRSQWKAIEEWIEYAMQHDIAGTREEAIMRACEVAMEDVRLDAEIEAFPEGATA